MKPAVAAVVVTYNNLEGLKRCIESVCHQSLLPDIVIVVNNSSTDGTSEWLNDIDSVIQLRQENSGSAGGQYTGIKWAYNHGYDFIWCLEDDIWPESDCLKKLISFSEQRKYRFSALASLRKYSNNDMPVLSEYISFNFNNIRHSKRYIRISTGDISLPVVPIRVATFEGLLISRVAVTLSGFPDKSFFLWYDDFEYCLRLGRYYPILILTEAIVYKHPAAIPEETISNNNSLYGVFIKRLYGLRNLVFLEKVLRIKFHPLQKIISIVSSVNAAFSCLLFILRNCKLCSTGLLYSTYLILIFFRNGLINRKGPFVFSPALTCSNNQKPVQQ